MRLECSGQAQLELLLAASERVRTATNKLLCENLTLPRRFGTFWEKHHLTFTTRCHLEDFVAIDTNKIYQFTLSSTPKTMTNYQLYQKSHQLPPCASPQKSQMDLTDGWAPPKAIKPWVISNKCAWQELEGLGRSTCKGGISFKFIELLRLMFK